VLVESLLSDELKDDALLSVEEVLSLDAELALEADDALLWLLGEDAVLLVESLLALERLDSEL
jgi:hypothetical protein